MLQEDIENIADIETLAAKIGEKLATPFTIDGNQVQTTASIGIVPYCGDIAAVDVMMMKADLALYRAKNEGRNQFRFHVARTGQSRPSERMIIGEELRHAIERGELELYYQPQVEVKSGSIIGLEALIRWNHPKRGLMLPAAFIPIAETTGSIVSIGEWVIDHACQQIKAWRQLGIAPPTIAVNISGANSGWRRNLIRSSPKISARYNVAPERLELELTESVLIKERNVTARHSIGFEETGVRLADRRFWHWLFLVRLFAVISCLPPEDRTRFIANVRLTPMTQRSCVHHRARARTRHRADGGRGGNRRATGFPDLGRLQACTGILFRQADADSGGERIVAPRGSGARVQI